MAEPFALPPGTAESLASVHPGEGSAVFVCPVCYAAKAIAVPVGPRGLWEEFYQAVMDDHIEGHFRKLEGRS